MTTTAKTIRAIIDEGMDLHLERTQELFGLWVSLLARKHPFLLGPPGTGKTRLIHWMMSVITGPGVHGEDPVLWEQLFNNQLSLDDIFGPIDMVAFDKQGLWHRKIDGYLPTAHIGFGDEQFKANGSVINPMLACLADFQAHVNSQPVPIPLLMYVMASNELSDDPSTGAFWDRRGLAYVIDDDIREEANFDALLQIAAGDIGPKAQPTTIALADLQRAVFEEVPAVNVPSGIREAIRALRQSFKHPQQGEPKILASPRRWAHFVRILQANAYLNDRDTIDDDDLTIGRHFFWETPEMRGTVDKRVFGLASPQTAKAMEVGELVDQWMAEVASVKGQSVAARAEKGAEVQGKMKRATNDLKVVRQEALAGGRSTSKIDEVRTRMGELRKAVLIECMNVPPETVAHIKEEDL